MRVFMISFDRALAGEGGTDAVERHRKYAERIDRLAIVVVTPSGTYQRFALGEHLEVYPTNAKTVWGHGRAIVGHFLSVRKREGIDLIVAQDLAAPVALLLKFFSGVPLIASVHGVWWDAWFSAKRWWHRVYLPLLTWTLRHADAVRAVSHVLKKVLVNHGVRASRITVIPTPVDIRRFAQYDDERIHAIQLLYQYPIVVSVGRLEKEKGHDALLAAWKEVEKTGLRAHLVIIGDGSERVSLEKIIVSDFKNGSVTLLGAIDSQELPTYYHAAKVCALASLSESFGKVFVEAGASGIPVVATQTKGASEIIQDGITGHLVPVGDACAMAARIITLLKNPIDADAMGNAAREYVAGMYDGAKNIEKVIKLWSMVCKIKSKKI